MQSTRLRTEKEKMLAGELYNAADPLLTQERLHAHALAHQLNMTPRDDQVACRRILSELLPNAAPVIYVEPPVL